MQAQIIVLDRGSVFIQMVSMQNPNTLIWKDLRWTIWVLPFSTLCWLYYAGWSLITPYLIFFRGEGEGVSELGKIGFSLFALAIGLSLMYFSWGFYKLLFNEIRRQFIVRKAQFIGPDYYEFWGYYFKNTLMRATEIKNVESFEVSRRWKYIVTIFSMENPNYKIIMNDGKIFYLSGDMKDVESLKQHLENHRALQN